MLASMCAWPCGRRSSRQRAGAALKATGQADGALSQRPTGVMGQCTPRQTKQAAPRPERPDSTSGVQLWPRTCERAPRQRLVGLAQVMAVSAAPAAQLTVVGKRGPAYGTCKRGGPHSPKYVGDCQKTPPPQKGSSRSPADSGIWRNGLFALVGPASTVTASAGCGAVQTKTLRSTLGVR